MKLINRRYLNFPISDSERKQEGKECAGGTIACASGTPLKMNAPISKEGMLTSLGLIFQSIATVSRYLFDDCKVYNGKDMASPQKAHI